MGLTRQQKYDRTWDRIEKIREQKQEKMKATIDRIQEAINDLAKLRDEGVINQELFLMIFDKITEGRNYLVGYMETKPF